MSILSINITIAPQENTKNYAYFCKKRIEADKRMEANWGKILKNPEGVNRKIKK